MATPAKHLITALREKQKDHDEAKDGPIYSLEYYPPKTQKGVEGLYKRFWRMSQQDSLFYDVTWGAGGTTSDLTMGLCKNAHSLFDMRMNMHLTCTNMDAKLVDEALEEAKSHGITNIVALRGDAPEGADKWEAKEGGFTCALDLVKFIKKKYNDFFHISVAGYPEGHPNAITKVEEKDQANLSETEKGRLIFIGEEQFVCTDKAYESEIAYLKSKVDAGASVIITQLFYDAAVFASFVKDCRKAGVPASVPIVPGIMPITNYGGFKRMTGFCKTRVPVELAKRIEEAKDLSKEDFKAFGLQVTTDLCKAVLATGFVEILHFYCLNQEDPAYTVLRNLGVSIKKTEDLDQAAMEKAYAQVPALCENLNLPPPPAKKPVAAASPAKKQKTDA